MTRAGVLLFARSFSFLRSSAVQRTRRLPLDRVALRRVDGLALVPFAVARDVRRDELVDVRAM